MNQKIPRIGILTNLLTVEEGPLVGSERIYVNRDYVNCIVKAGGIPLLIPILSDESLLKNLINQMDGLLVTGGQDVNPIHYGEEPSLYLGAVCLERDEFEIALLNHAYLAKKPILGICRGLQILNVAFGGSLIQDINHEDPKCYYQHNQNAKKETPFHTVELFSETRLYSIFQTSTLVTNSFHHQAIKKVASNFKVSAKAKDGIIEGIELKDSSLFVLGVQWHPEMMAEKHPEMMKLFKAFVDHTNH